MKRKKNEFYFLLLQCALLIMLCGCLPPPDDAIAYDSAAAVSAVEDALFQGEKQCTAKYLSRSFSEEILRTDLENSLQTDYLFSCLLNDLSFTFEKHLSYVEVTFQLTYSDSADFDSRIMTASNDSQMRGVLAEIMKQNARKTPILLQDYSLSEEKLVSLLKEAEINCAQAPYEYRGIHYSRYTPADEQQLMIVWGEAAVSEKLMTETKKELQTAFSQWTAQISETQPPNRTASYQAIYDALCGAVTYDEEIAALSSGSPEKLTDDMRRNRTAYGALITGSTVCSGYARSFQGICEGLGLPCYVMTGSFGGVPHAWNAVQIDGQTLFIDCTNGDEGSLRQAAFLFTASEAKAMGYLPDSCCHIPWEN